MKKFPFPLDMGLKTFSPGCWSCWRATLRRATSSSREVSLSCWARAASPSSLSSAGRPSRPCARPYSRPATARSRASSRLEIVLFASVGSGRIRIIFGSQYTYYLDLKMDNFLRLKNPSNIFHFHRIGSAIFLRRSDTDLFYSKWSLHWS